MARVKYPFIVRYNNADGSTDYSKEDAVRGWTTTRDQLEATVYKNLKEFKGDKGNGYGLTPTEFIKFVSPIGPLQLPDRELVYVGE